MLTPKSLSQGHPSEAQLEASEFLIVTYFDDLDRVALLPRKLYWPLAKDESCEDILILDISAMSMNDYCFHIDCLLANIQVLGGMSRHPADPTTVPFQVALDGHIPEASTPKTIMPQASEPEEEGLRAIHRRFLQFSDNMKVDFLDYQPLLRDFKFVVSPCDEFPDGLEPVISHILRDSDPLRQTIHSSDDPQEDRIVRDSDALSDYLLRQRPRESHRSYYFVPRRILPQDWFPNPHAEKELPKDLYDSGRRIKPKEFFLDTDPADEFVERVWELIRKYPPSPPTPAQEKQKIWKREVPWLETAAEAERKRKEAPKPEENRVPGTGDDSAEKPSDSSMLLSHYTKNLGLEDENREHDAT